MKKENIILNVKEQLLNDGDVHSIMYDEKHQITYVNFVKELNSADLHNIANEIGDNMIVWGDEIITETRHVDTIINLFWPEHCATNGINIWDRDKFMAYYRESLDDNLKNATLIECENKRNNSPFQIKECACCGKSYIGFGYTVSNLHPVCYSCYYHHSMAETDKLFSSLDTPNNSL